MSVHQGFNTGNDDIFVRPWSHIADKEREIYVTHIPDRVMRKYSVPRLLESAVFYPYKDGAPLKREELRDQYPDTWKYLRGHRKKLQKRRAALSGEREWWRPDRPRIPKDLLQPKILTPHLCITPRFSVDLSGNLAPSRSPYFVVAKEFEPLEPSFLKLFCAFLNSSVARWYIAKYAFRYGRGYARLEVSNLRDFPIPDPQQIPARISSQLLRLVDVCLTDEEHDSKFEEIDKLVCNLYGLTEGESETLRETF
jgi:hypothetical protein